MLHVDKEIELLNGNQKIKLLAMKVKSLEAHTSIQFVNLWVSIKESHAQTLWFAHQSHANGFNVSYSFQTNEKCYRCSQKHY